MAKTKSLQNRNIYLRVLNLFRENETMQIACMACSVQYISHTGCSPSLCLCVKSRDDFLRIIFNLRKWKNANKEGYKYHLGLELQLGSRLRSEWLMVVMLIWKTWTKNHSISYQTKNMCVENFVYFNCKWDYSLLFH